MEANIIVRQLIQTWYFYLKEHYICHVTLWSTPYCICAFIRAHQTLNIIYINCKVLFGAILLAQYLIQMENNWKLESC